MQPTMMIVHSSRINGLGVFDAIGQEPTSDSYLIVRVIDRNGRPVTGIKILAVDRADLKKPIVRGETNGDGISVMRFPSTKEGTPVTMQLTLPEGDAYRDSITVSGSSGRVEVFHSLVSTKEPVLNAAEAVGFGLGLALATIGLSLKDHGAREVVVGLGSGVFAISGWSFVFRHLR